MSSPTTAKISERTSSRWFVAALVVVFILSSLGTYGLVHWLTSTQVSHEGAEVHWQQAMQALEAEDLALAKTHLAQCLEVWPIHAETHFLMARTCRRTNDASGWQAHLRQAQVLGWNKDAVDLERDLMQAQQGHVLPVERKLLDYLAAHPADEEIVCEALARGYLAAQLLVPLLELTRIWIERYPDHWQPHLSRGRVFQLGHSTDRAISEYRYVLERKPDHAAAHRELAEALMVNAEFAEALTHFEAYLRHHPEEPGAQVGRANCQFSLGQFDAARASLDQLFSRTQEVAAACFVRAKVELAVDQPGEALRWLTRAEALAPHEPDITYYQVLVLQRLGRADEAKKYEQKLQTDRRQFDRLDEIKKQILTDARNPTLRQQAGAVALSLGRKLEALNWLDSALLLEPNHAPTHRLLAEYYEKSGEGQRAAYHRRQAERGRQ